MSNNLSNEMTKLLLATNMAANTSTLESCAFLRSSVNSWLLAASQQPTLYNLLDEQQENVYLTWAQLLPVRCSWQQPNGLITTCRDNPALQDLASCSFWNSTFSIVNESQPSREYLASELSVREGGISLSQNVGTGPANFGTGNMSAVFYVSAAWNNNQKIALT
jgi:hypothetical protein